MPVAQLIVEALILACFKNFAQAQPTTADCLADIPHTAFFHKLVGHIFVAVSLLLELNDAGVVGIVVSGDALRDRSEAARNPALLGRGLVFFNLTCFAGLWVVVACCGVPELESLCQNCETNCACLQLCERGWRGGCRDNLRRGHQTHSLRGGRIRSFGGARLPRRLTFVVSSFSEKACPDSDSSLLIECLGSCFK